MVISGLPGEEGPHILTRFYHLQPAFFCGCSLSGRVALPTPAQKTPGSHMVDVLLVQRRDS